MRKGTFYNDEVELYNVDKDQHVTAEVVHFEPEKSLLCSVNKMIEIRMNYTKHGEYVGSKAGMEFKTQGPKLL
jgi:hypothetical protein